MAGDGVFDLGFALGNLIVVHFGMILEYSPIVAQDYACDARQLAVACKPPIFVIISKIPEVGYNFRDSHRKHGMTV